MAYVTKAQAEAARATLVARAKQETAAALAAHETAMRDVAAAVGGADLDLAPVNAWVEACLRADRANKTHSMTDDDTVRRWHMNNFTRALTTVAQALAFTPEQVGALLVAVQNTAKEV